ncbi:UNKNOWN [Stylonychia lemnae]|uniref:Uncharacterized protein n=1 Tax=Stylonychia lemnae TaxID=5949 RepID=A0A077ZT39_STYLE|nr:UNKNOWN [Stylonychia lemnae]|eukprot:CDW73052.1 UNKNOWN [Stylonychia lemnae]
MKSQQSSKQQIKPITQPFQPKIEQVKIEAIVPRLTNQEKLKQMIEKQSQDISNRRDVTYVVKKLKAKFKKQQLEEQLLHITMSQNAISKKEYDQKLQLIKEQQEIIEELLEQDNLLKQKLGIVSHLKTIENYHDRANNENKSETVKKEKKAKSFIKRIHIEKQQREQQMQKLQQDQQQKLEKEEKKRQKMEEEKQKEIELETKVKKQELKQKIQKQTEDRIKFKEETEKAIKVVKKQKPVYLVIEEKYKTEVEIPELEEKKQKLKELRDMFQPIKDLKINKHTKKYEATRKQMETEIKKQRNLSMKSLQEHMSRLKYQPHLSDEFDEMRKQIDEQHRIKEQRERIHEKVSNYAKFVKEVYWPKVSDDKRNELDQMKERIKTQKLQRSASWSQKVKQNHHYIPPGGRNTELGRYGMHDTMELTGDTRNHRTLGGSNSVLEVRSPNQIKSAKSKWGGGKNNNMSLDTLILHPTQNNYNSESLKNLGKSKDYLKDQRIQRDLDELEGKKKKQIGNDKMWNNFLSDQTISEYKKIEDIRRVAEMLESKAKMNEQYARNTADKHNSTINIEKSIAANEKYLEAIKVKLKVLDHL